MTKENALYQAKLILDSLPDKEYDLIPENTIKYIEENMKYSKDIVFNPDIPFENQEIDEKTYDILEKVIFEIENPSVDIINNKENISVNNLGKEEMIKLLEKYKEENRKILKAKELVKEYKDCLEKKEKQILELKNINQELYISIQKCPKLIRKIFFNRLEKKLLN